MSVNARSRSGSGAFVSLSIMMFLEFFIWGGWYVTCGNYMAEHGMNDKIFIAYMLCPIAAIVSPFFLGMIADRFFATQKVLGVMSLLGGLALLAVPSVATNPTLFIGLLLVHALCYMPTLGLTSTVAFHHVTDQEKQFPIIRVFGTIGWIVAGILVSKVLHGDTQPIQFMVAGAAAIALGVFSFVLPNTPPPAAGKKATARDILGLDSLALFKKPAYQVFILCSLLICIPLQFYYSYAQVFVHEFRSEAAFYMSFGQMFEVFFMVIMPLLFLRLGVKYMLFAGMVAWVVRYGLFALAAGNHMFPLVMGGVILHGICYDFFFVTGQIYVDKRCSSRIRGQAQGFFVLVTQGVGMLIGSAVSGTIYNNYSTKVGEAVQVNWHMLWTLPALAAAVIAVIFLVMFKDDSNQPVEEAEAALAN